MKNKCLFTCIVSRKISAILLMIISFALILMSCEKIIEPKSTSPEMVLVWNKQVQKIYTYPVGGLPPPIISRLFASYHIAMHDAINSVIPKYKTYTVTTVDNDADPDAAVVQAIYEMLIQIGPKDEKNKFSIDSLYVASMATIAEGTSKDKGIALGKTVAAAVLAKRAADLPYIVVTGYNPTPPSGTVPGEYKYIAPLNYALAGFHLINTWVIDNGKQFPVEPPYAINSLEYTADYNEVKQLGELNSVDRTADQKEIAIFWAENTSRGWNDVTREILNKVGNPSDAWEAARMFALLHLTIADAYISVFDSKIHYNYWRPITAIREGENDGNDDTEGNANWSPTLPTPAIGEYPSAHALTGAAAGQFLINYFGKSKISISLSSGYLPGKNRSFESLTDAIRENSLSRIYLGFHFRKAIDDGEEAGYKIGDYVYANGLPEK